MKISIIRGAFINPYEMQNYYPLERYHDIVAVSSKRPLNSDIDLPLVKLLSPTDMPNIPFKYPILNRLFVDAHYLLGLENVLKGCDIAHVAETYYHYTIQAIMAKKKGLVKKVVSTVWEVIPHNNEGILGRSSYKQLAYKHIDHFLAVTEKAKDALITEGVGEDKISVVPVGVDLSVFKPNPAINDKHQIDILFVGRLVKEKGILDLLQVLSPLNKHYQNLHLTVIGSGPLLSEVSSYPYITVTNTPYSQIHKYYQQADIFVLPSQFTPTWQEQFGMVLVEAMATGLPIIATNSGAIPEVVGDSALLYQPGDTVGLKEHLVKLITNRTLRNNLSNKSLNRARSNYNHLDISHKINLIYKSLF